MARKTEGKLNVAIIGSQGVPPKYGGFETLVDNLLTHKSEDVDYTVFCSGPDMASGLSEYKGAKLRYVQLRAHGVMSVPYDIISMIKTFTGYDAVLILGVSGGMFLPVFKLLSKAKTIVNIDGLEFKRKKWKKFAAKFLKKSLDSCVRWADVIVSDNKGIQDYVRRHYGKEAKLISYGGDHALRKLEISRQESLLDYYGLAAKKYDLSICRIEPENNCDLTLETYQDCGRELVFVGNWHHSDYSRSLYLQYKDNPHLHLLDSIYDADILYTLRNNARRYIHGHRAGGTNPSLVEAMQFDIPLIVFDVVYNRETTFNLANYYHDKDSLSKLIQSDTLESNLKEKASAEYNWRHIAGQYENLYNAKPDVS